jgi:hypothetical protein
MSGKVPFFITGANCKIKVNGVTMAYATDISYSVQINHQQAKVCGMYEADTLEPVAYSITGQFTVIKYIDSLKSLLASKGFKVPDGASNQGNGVGSMTAASGFGRALGALGGDFTGGRAYDALDPSKLSRITGFDVEIYQKVPDTGRASTVNVIGGILTGNQVSENGVLGIARLRDCHISGVTTQVSRKGLMTQTYSFIANYLDEDTFISSASDSGQRIV